jgi:hypothetical protein
MEFPSVEFFERLRALAEQHHERFEKNGYFDSAVALRMVGDAGATRSFLLRFDMYAPVEIRELDDREWVGMCNAEEIDFTLEGSLVTWREMIENIQAHNGADTRHTLNTLALPGVPLALVSHNQVDADKFYRYNQSYQDFFDLAAELGDNSGRK